MKSVHNRADDAIENCPRDVLFWTEQDIGESQIVCMCALCVPVVTVQVRTQCSVQHLCVHVHACTVAACSCNKWGLGIAERMGCGRS